MSHFAKIENNSVTQVIVAEQSFIDTMSGTWIQTSYNTRGGIHYGSDNQPDGGIALRGNYAGIGYVYDSILDVFYPPKPNNLYQLNETVFLWELKPEYSPLVTAVTQSPLPTLPTGVIDNTIVVNGVTIKDGQYVLFPDLTVESGVYKYTTATGIFTRVPYNDFSVVVVGEDYSIVYKYVNIDWVGTAVQP
jgi:hypothetical protein